ncbi:MAG: diaminopimelate epimerase [Fibrobacter sp.]|nr:diaminopimelate epimerase [Fibrobacter sp.]
MNFIKMQGLGNDFIVTHDVKEKDISRIQNQFVTLCDRRKGIGADGIVFVLESSLCDFKMKIFNSDGSEAEMCGNGIRCFAIYVNLLDLNSSPKLTIETLAGKITTEVVGNNRVTVNMGVPVLDADKIPVADTGHITMKPLVIDNKEFAITCVSMGNPHAVIYADDLTDELVLGYGPKIEKNSYFPKKTNVEFIKVLSNKELQMRVWERGCGETQACGTGACASVVSGIINTLHEKSVTVHLPGGNLAISWGGEVTDPVMMTGPAEVVFEGRVRVD